MVMSKEQREAVIKDYAVKEKDNGSPEVQVALLTSRIKYMTEHVKVNKNDQHNRRGLEMMVARRTKLLKYLMDSDFARYRGLIQRLGLRR
ncbi:MAG: 30S ribosomal protein S15 [Planctomycetota bacterium]